MCTGIHLMYSFGADVDEVKLGASRIVYYQPRSTWLVLTNSTRQSGFGSSPRRSRKTMSRSPLLTPGGENGRAPLSMTPRPSREAPPKECTALHHPSPAWVRSKEQFRLSSDCHAEVVFSPNRVSELPIGSPTRADENQGSKGGTKRSS